MRDVPWVLLAGLAAGCAVSGPSPPSGSLVGTWGGDDAGFLVTGSGAHAHIGCTLGDVTQPIAAGPDGRFDVPGEYNITAYPVDLGIRHPARFIGTVDGRRMLLTVVLTDTAVSLGPVLLRYGEEPRMGPCPICRMPAAVSPPTTGSPVWGAHRFLAAFGPPGGGR